MRGTGVDRSDVQRWFDSLSGTSGSANRVLPVLSAMRRQAELWDIRPQGSNPCRNMRRYRTAPRERFLSLEELRRIGFVLAHAGDRQAAAIRLLLFTGTRSSEIAGLDDVRLHDCRHTFASHAVMSGLALSAVGRLLGHADVASTERYAHLADEQVREAAGRLSGIGHGAMNGKESGR